MAFKLYSTNDGHVPAWEYIACGAIAPQVGMALYITGGKLAVAGGSNKPEYICMTEEVKDVIPVVRIDDTQVWEVIADATEEVGAEKGVGADGLTLGDGTGYTVVGAQADEGGYAIRGVFTL